MKILVSEGDFDTRESLVKAFSPYGKCDVTTDGHESIEAFLLSLDGEEPYDIICLDIMSLRTDGLKILRAIREKENMLGVEKVKIIFTSKSPDIEKIFNAIATKDEFYTSRPLDKDMVKHIIQSKWPDKLNVDK